MKKKILNALTKVNKSGFNVVLLTIIGYVLAFVEFAYFTKLIDTGVIDASIGGWAGVLSTMSLSVIVLPIVGSYGLEKLEQICASKLSEIDNGNETKEEILTYTKEIENSPVKQHSKNNVQNIEINPQIEEIFNDSVKYNLINEPVLDEWHEYLYNTYTYELYNIAFIQNLMYKLIVLNDIPISECAKELSNDENITNLLIHFGRKGNELANALNIPIVESKREITK